MELRVMWFLAPGGLVAVRIDAPGVYRFRDSARRAPCRAGWGTANDDNTPKLRQTAPIGTKSPPGDHLSQWCQNHASAERQIRAILIARDPGNEPAGSKAVGKPRKSLTRYCGRPRPDAGVLVAPQRAPQNVFCDIEEKRRDDRGQFLSAMVAKPRLHPSDGARHGGESVAVARDGASGSDERRIDGGSARARRIKHVADALAQRHRHIGLEDLDDIERPGAQCLEVLGHRPIGP